jgi:hypothetical protein
VVVQALAAVGHIVLIAFIFACLLIYPEQFIQTTIANWKETSLQVEAKQFIPRCKGSISHFDQSSAVDK